MQTIVNEALETGLALYERRHPEARGLIQGAVVVLRNADAAILAEAGGRHFYRNRYTQYSDLNRATGSLRQPGSAWKPQVYLAAFRQGLNLDTTVPDEPIGDRKARGTADLPRDHGPRLPAGARGAGALARSRTGSTKYLVRQAALKADRDDPQPQGLPTE